MSHDPVPRHWEPAQTLFEGNGSYDVNTFRNFDPSVDNADFTLLENSKINEAVRKDLAIVADFARSAKTSAIIIDHFFSLLIGKGINFTVSNIISYFSLTENSTIAGNRIILKLREKLREKGFELTSLGWAEHYISNERGIYAVANVHHNPTHISFAFSGAQPLVLLIEKIVKDCAIIDHPAAASRLRLDDRNQIQCNAKRLSVHPIDNNDVWKVFYPYFDFTPQELWDEFAANRANTILIYGSPGLGKTTFIRAMMDHRGYKDIPYLVDDQNVLEHPGLIGFLSDLNYGSLLVSEDSDNLVRKRESDNKQMTGLLNTGEGISSGGLKMIISTNLKNLNEVDEALYRPGRTFRQLKFELLTHSQANAAREVIGLAPVDFKGKDHVSLAVALNYEASLTGSGSTFGFNQVA